MCACFGVSCRPIVLLAAVVDCEEENGLHLGAYTVHAQARLVHI